MASVFISSVIPASSEDVWEKIRDFNGLPRWHPVVRDSRIQDGLHPDQVGCIRDFRLQNGDRITEQLVGLSDYDMTTTYTILESPMPLTGYVATLRLTPITDGNRTFAEWSAEFDCAEEDEQGLVDGIGNDVFQAGFDALKRHFGQGS
ncbi:MAG: SRPBCC family protein [Rhodobacteraceae bacterium]|nr:SRPBCC family protein [Paracoccaceae bacterium]